MIFGRHIKKTLEQSSRVSLFMLVCFLLTFRLSNQTPKITRILTLYHANAPTLTKCNFLNIHLSL